VIPPSKLGTPTMNGTGYLAEPTVFAPARNDMRIAQACTQYKRSGWIWP